MRAHGGHVGDTQNEADGVQNIGLTTAIKARDGIETLVPAIVSVCDMNALVAGKLFTHHPETTVRTAYDLKPCDVVSCQGLSVLSTFTHVDYDFGDPHGSELRDGAAVVVVVVVVGIGMWRYGQALVCTRLCLQKIGCATQQRGPRYGRYLYTSTYVP